MYEAKKVIEAIIDVKDGKTVDGDTAVANVRNNLSDYVSTIWLRTIKPELYLLILLLQFSKK